MTAMADALHLPTTPDVSSDDNPAGDHPLTRSAWMEYALIRIRSLVNKPPGEMTDDELAIYTFATSALVGGTPIVPMMGQDSMRMCRVCGETWPKATAAHAVGCPVRG